MKITIENLSSRDISDVTSFVAELMRREHDFMLANTATGCQFTCGDNGIVVALLSVATDRPAGEMHFFVMDKVNPK